MVSSSCGGHFISTHSVPVHAVRPRPNNKRPLYGDCGVLFFTAFFTFLLIVPPNQILEKPLKSVCRLVGALSALPGAFSAYRYIALQNDANGSGSLEMYSGTGVIRDTNRAGFVWEVYPGLTSHPSTLRAKGCMLAPCWMAFSKGTCTWPKTGYSFLTLAAPYGACPRGAVSIGACAPRRLGSMCRWPGCRPLWPFS